MNLYNIIFGDKVMVVIYLYIDVGRFLYNINIYRRCYKFDYGI